MFPQLFQRRSRKHSPEKDDANETFRTLMDARFDRLEQNFTALRTEWADTYDKIMHLYDRTRKRVKKAEVAPDEEKPVMPIPESQQREMVLQAFTRGNGR